MIKNKKKVTALIPARGGSKGIKNKNIKILNSHPLIYWTINAALNAKYIDKVVVSTDSNRIAKISEKYGAIIPGLRPKKHSKDNSSTESVIEHYINNWSTKNEETIILLQPTSPIRKKNLIDSSISKFFDGCYDSLLSITQVQNHFIWKTNNYKTIPLYDINNRLRKQDISKEDHIYFENGSIYIFDINKFKKFKNRLFGKIGHIIIDKKESIDIDSSEDFKIASNIMKIKI